MLPLQRPEVKHVVDPRSLGGHRGERGEWVFQERCDLQQVLLGNGECGMGCVEWGLGNVEWKKAKTIN